MDILFSGKPVYTDKVLLRKALNLYAELLLGPKLSQYVRLHVDFDKSLEKNKDIGYCALLTVEGKPREFEFTISPYIKKRMMLLTLAHEMVHLKQYAHGELKDHRGRLMKWNGKVMTTDDYWFLPWEIEAHGREKGLYYKFIELEKKRKK